MKKTEKKESSVPEEIEYKINLGILAFISITFTIILLKVIFGIQQAFSSLYLLYFMVFWWFDRSVTIFKKEIKRQKH